MLSNRHLVVKHIKLLAETNLFANLGKVGLNRLAEKSSVATAHIVHASQHVNGGSLACAIVAQKCHDLVLLDGQRHSVDSREASKLHSNPLELYRVRRSDLLCADTLVGELFVLVNFLTA